MNSYRSSTTRRVALLVAAVVLGALAPRGAAAQQDTTHHMPGMPGMQMPKPAAKKPAAQKKKPVKKAAKKAVRKAATKPAHAGHAMPPMTDSMHAGHVMPMPAKADSAHAGHVMPMPMPAKADTGHAGHVMAPAAAPHAAHVMPGADRDTVRDTTAMAGMPGMAGMTMMAPDPLGVSMDRMGSGTTWVPEAAPIPSLYYAAPGRWDITGHGFGFLQYDRQGGPRGDDQVGSLNWIMLMAGHELAGGRFQARTMLSLDAATVTPRGYPLLLQSGEAYEGQPLHDRQHPHDAFMELSVLYERAITRSVGLMLYAAPSGEPALGPVAFMHRPSAMDNPVAPITHHWADATHISFGVLTAGLFTSTVKLEASYFNSREPDQSRFNFDPIRLDSWSGRLSWNPGTDWGFAAGYGLLKSPEALEPDESTRRVTLSALHGTPIGHEGQWASSVVYGANAHASHGGYSHSLLLESEAVLDARHTVFGRAEAVQKSAADLVLDTPQYGFASDDEFTVGEASLGYIRDFARLGAGTFGIGAMGTVNVVPSALQGAYGSRTPLGALVFLRVRPARTGMSMRAAPAAMPGMTRHDH